MAVTAVPLNHQLALNEALIPSQSPTLEVLLCENMQQK
jgi:hypothetical protein